jgi:hypothetical protein
MTATIPTTRRILIAGVGAAAIVVIGVLVWFLRPTPAGPVVMHAGTPHHAVTATVGSAKTGTTAIDVDLTDRAGGPALPATVEIEAVMPLMGHATPPVTAVPSGGGHYRADAVPLLMAGPWELRLSISTPDGVDNLTLPISVGN